MRGRFQMVEISKAHLLRKGWRSEFVISSSPPRAADSLERPEPLQRAETALASRGHENPLGTPLRRLAALSFVALSASQSLALGPLMDAVREAAPVGSFEPRHKRPVGGPDKTSPHLHVAPEPVC